MYWKWIIALGIIFELHYAWSLTPGQGYAWFWTPFTCLNILAGLCKFYAWIENQLDSFKYYAPIFRAIWRLVHPITIYGLSAWSASAFTPGFRVVTRRHFSYRITCTATKNISIPPILSKHKYEGIWKRSQVWAP